jgi:tetratricopeptide (TPR) repeat protein
LRYTAVENYNANDSAGLMRIIAPLLNDPIKSVRMEAANRLATFKKESFNEIQYRLFRKALDEYRISQEYVADFPAGRYNLGNYYSKLNEPAKAEENYREAIAIDNLFYPAKANLGLIYYRQGKLDAAEQLFRDIVTRHPDVIDGYYYLALLYSEQKKYSEAITLLETASIKSNCNPRIFYNLGLLYQMTGQNVKCEATLGKGLRLDPCNFDLLYALFSFYLKENNRTKAAPMVEKLRSCYPDEKQVQDLYKDFIGNERPSRF